MFYRTSRFLSRLRLRQPAIFILPGLIAGQVIGSQINLLLGLALVIILTLFLVRARKFLGLSAGLALGLLSSLQFAQDTVQTRNTVQTSKLEAKVLGRIEQSGLRYPKLGLMIFGFEVLQTYEEHNYKTKNPWPQKGSHFKCQAISLPWRNIAAASAGELLLVQATFNPFLKNLWPWEYDASLARRGYAGTCKLRYATRLEHIKSDFLDDFRSRLLQAYHHTAGTDQIAGLLLSLSLGVRDQISTSSERLFKDLGISHVLVLSGMQIGLIFFAVAFVFRRGLRFVLGHRPTLVNFLTYCLAGMISAILVHLTHYEASATRAWIACVVLAIASSAERETGIMRGSITSFLVLSLIWPGCWAEAGVQLSFAALFGIAIGQDLAISRLEKFIFPCLLATLCTAVVSAAWFETLSVSAVLANFLIAPWFSILGCYLGFFLVLVCYLSVPFVDEIAMLIKWFMTICMAVVGRLHAVLPQPLELELKHCLALLVVFLLFCLWYFFRKGRDWVREFNFLRGA